MANTKLKLEPIRRLTMLTLFILVSTLASGQESITTKPTLLIFSGSDWCIPCIRFEKDVRQDPQFIKFAEQNLNLIVADFPQRKKLAKETVQRNEVLAEKYNPKGIFPLVLLLDDQGEKLTEVETNKVVSKSVINQINQYLLQNDLQEHRRSAILMGNAFQVTLIAPENKGELLLDDCINEIKAIEAWLSSWQVGSVTSKINAQAGKGSVIVDDEYYQLIQRCNKISDMTQGAFDISFNGLSELYTFDQGEYELPSQDEINKVVAHIGYRKIKLDEANRVGLDDPLMKIAFGAIGKGYAAERVKNLMLAKGVTGGVINASGDLTTWGRRNNGTSWNIGIPNPDDKNDVVLWLPLDEKAIATSGDYEKYFTSKGQRYSHIINPITGLPVVGSRSVSVISDNAELSDALATAVAVLGVDVGLNLINQLSGVECVFIDNNSKLHFSNGLKPYEN